MNNQDIEFYFTHDNGSRPFLVYLKNGSATVYKKKNNRFPTDRTEYNTQVYTTKYTQAFIGESPKDPMTDFSGCWGPEFRGNSILLHIKNLEYVYIGECIKTFTAVSKIVKYQSSVGNNDVPYPFAVDDQNRYYMMLDDATMKEPLLYDHPYTVYYRLSEMLLNDCVNVESRAYGGYKGFYIGKEPYMLRWDSKPINDFRRMEEEYQDFNDHHPLYLMRNDNSMQELTEDIYVALMNKFGNEHNLSVFETAIIVPRRF